MGPESIVRYPRARDPEGTALVVELVGAPRRVRRDGAELRLGIMWDHDAAEDNIAAMLIVLKFNTFEPIRAAPATRPSQRPVMFTAEESPPSAPQEVIPIGGLPVVPSMLPRLEVVPRRPGDEPRMAIGLVAVATELFTKRPGRVVLGVPLSSTQGEALVAAMMASLKIRRVNIAGDEVEFTRWPSAASPTSPVLH